jgi:hypothetical protein
MSLINLTNEIVNLVASVTTFVFPVGIAIFVFEFKNMKDALEKNEESTIESVIMPKLERLIRKTNRLFCKFKPRCPHFPAVLNTAPVSPWESSQWYHAPVHG